MKRMLTILTVLAMVLVACGGGDTTDTTAAADTAAETTAAPDTTTAPETTAAADTTTGGSDTTAGATDTTGGSEGVAAGQIDDCLVGTWTVGPDQFKEMMSQPGMEEIQAEVSGDLTATFNDDNTFEYSANDMNISMELPDMSLPEDSEITMPSGFDMLMTGNATGTYSADGTQMSVTIEENNLSMTMNGEEMPGADEIVPTSTDEYTCEGDTLEMAEITFTRS